MNTKRLLSTAFGAIALIGLASACSSGSDADNEDDATTTVAASSDGATTETSPECEATAALFKTRGSANPDLPDPKSSAECVGDTIVVTANAVPDYTYIGTSPGEPRGFDMTYEFPSTPSVAAETTEAPLLGALGVALNGIPLYGPTEGPGGDARANEQLLSECGSHNGPTDFHMHFLGYTDSTDCIFTPEEIASGHQLLGYAFDGFPIYSGNAQFESSWELTDETLFATDTWAAHEYIEGSGDLDRCNGLTDEEGNYAYYTTDSFPYFLGCFVGEVELTGPGEGDRPEPPEGEERPERPEQPDDEERPERPEPPEGEERPEPPEGQEPPAPA